MTSADVETRIRAVVRDIADFPTPGILFKDITPVLAQPALLRAAVAAMSSPYDRAGVTHVAGIESRGFLFGVPIALALNCAFVPVRKPGKLPFDRVSEAYVLEYRSDTLEIHSDAFGSGARVLVVDDVLATGGTAAAASRLVERLGGHVVAVSVLLELEQLGGRLRLESRTVHAVTRY